METSNPLFKKGDWLTTTKEFAEVSEQLQLVENPFKLGRDAVNGFVSVHVIVNRSENARSIFKNLPVRYFKPSDPLDEEVRRNMTVVREQNLARPPTVVVAPKPQSPGDKPASQEHINILKNLDRISKMIEDVLGEGETKAAILDRLNTILSLTQSKEESFVTLQNKVASLENDVGELFRLVSKSRKTKEVHA